MITLELCKRHYHTLLMIYLGLIKKNRQMSLVIFLDLCLLYYHTLLIIYLRLITKKIESENKFINNFRSMLASLSYLVDYLSEINKKLSLIELSDKFS